jgi:N-acetylglucosamine kinase-like BadF-type ATPase
VFAAATSHICQTLEALLDGFGGLSGRYLACFAGISGGGPEGNRQRLASFFQHLLPGVHHLSNGSDAASALSSGIGSRDGIIQIAGTGSATFARRDGVYYQVGGWGYFFGNEGSGYMLGRLAIHHALRDTDGRGPRTLLRPLCEAQLGMPVVEAISLLYEGGVTQVASFAPLVFTACAQGDQLAGQILDQAADELFECIAVAARQIADPVRPVVAAGGVIRPGNAMHTRLLARMGPDYHLILPDLPPIYGSIVEAANLADLPVSAAFHDRFAITLGQAQTRQVTG